MKILSAALTMTLLFLQQAACTHLETCECHEIKALVNATIEQAINRLEEKFNDEISKIDNTVLTSTIEKLLEPIQKQLDYHLPLPPTATPSPQTVFSESNPAASCKAIYDAYSDAKSDYYWIKTSLGSPVRVYCKMDANCTGYTEGWMRVAHIDMRNSSHQCPSGLSLLTRSTNPRRVCDITHDGCVSKNFTVYGTNYSHVYGKVIAYQNRNPVGLHFNSRNIDQPYVYGVSLTHGQNPRKHIWTFVGATDETTSRPSFKCPCINTNIHSLIVIPSYVGNDYFCDTSLSNYYSTYSGTLYPDDPLWDGQGCGPSNTCCSVSSGCNKSPPWFIKHLPSYTNNDVEMRYCRPDPSGSTPIETVELYVQ